jgi:phytoene dehydrogenase-like protein
LFTSDALRGFRNRITFLLKFLKLIRSKPEYDAHLTVGQWIRQNVNHEDVATAIRAYAALTTYDGDIDAYPVNAFVEHARLMYEKKTPLVYMDFAQLLKQLEYAVISNGGEIKYGHRVTQLMIRDGVSGVMVNGEVHDADAVVLNLPPRYLAELSTNPQFQRKFNPR